MKRLINILFLLLFAAAFALPSTAQSSRPTISSLNEQIARVEEEIKRNEALLGKIKQDKNTTQNELKLVRSRITNRLQLVNSLRDQIGLCEQEISGMNSDIKNLQEEISKIKKQYSDMVYAAYKNHILNNSMAFLFASSDFNDASLRVDYMRRYNKLRAYKARQLDSMNTSLIGQVEVLDTRLKQLETSKRSRDKEVSSLKKDEDNFKKSTAQLTAQEKKIATQIRQKEQEKSKAQQQLQRMVEEEARRAAAQKKTAAQERQIAQLSDKFEQNEGKFPYPVSGGVIVDQFGKHPHPTQKGLTIDNKGVNIAGEKGAPVRSIFEGIVSRVVFIKGLNNCVMVNHGNYYTVYSNLAEVKVQPNDKVDRNQVLGNLPSTDDNNDYYLHFELWKGTTYLNPQRWLRP